MFYLLNIRKYLGDLRDFFKIFRSSDIIKKIIFKNLVNEGVVLF